MPDVDVHDISEAFETLVPHVFNDHGTRENAARLRSEIFQKAIFLGGKFDAFSVAFYQFGEPVDLQIGYFQQMSAGGGLAAKQCLDADLQFCESKRLGEVVVRAGFEVFDLVLGGIAGSQNEDGRVTAVFAEAPKDLG